MSVIQTIRNRFGKIAGAVIAIALISFIVSDARNGSFASFFKGHDTSVMKVNGTKVESIDFQKRVNEFKLLTSLFSSKPTIDETQSAQISEQVLENMAFETFVNSQCDKLGINITDDEQKELVYGMNAHNMIRQFKYNGNEIFIDPQTHQFNPAGVKEWEKALAQRGSEIDPDGKYRDNWNAVKDYVTRNARTDKFSIMFASSVYAPVYVAKRMLDDEKKIANIKCIKIPYSSVPDNEVKVTDDDIKNYIKNHPGSFENDQETRTIEYVSFDMIPSADDTAKPLSEITTLKTEFATTKDKDIKSFVGSRSDDPDNYSEAFYNKRTFTSDEADSIMNLPVGSVYGPYFENGGFNITKVVDRQTLPDSVKCRHILVRTKEKGNETLSDSAGKKKIDSIAAQIKNGVPFDSIVVACSDDNPEMNKKGGVYELTLANRPNFIKEFGDFVFEGKKGETKIVKVDNPGYSGYHYIEILDQKDIEPCIKVATVVKRLDPSGATQNLIFGKANEFADKCKSAKDFDENAKKAGKDKRIGSDIKASSYIIAGVGPARDVIKWMYDSKTKVGDVSPVFNLNNQRFIVAVLASVTEKGLAGVTPQNRPMIEQKVKEEKKAELIKSKYANAKTLDAIAAQANEQVQEFDSIKVTSNSLSGVAGSESKVVGYAFCPSFQPNTLSPAIKGQGGVYYITVLSRADVEDPEAMQKVMQERRMQEMQTRNYIVQMLQQAINRKANIKYNPENF